MSFIHHNRLYDRVRTHGGWRSSLFRFQQPGNPDPPSAVPQSASWSRWELYESIGDNFKLHLSPRSVSSAYHERVGGLLSAMPRMSGDYGLPIYNLSSSQPYLETSMLNDMIPHVPDEVLSNFCLDSFNEFSEIWPELLSFGEFAQGLTQFRELAPRIEDRISKTISSGYLNTQFGWISLLSDLEQLRDLTKNVSARMEYLRKIRGIGTRLHKHRSLDASDFGTSVELVHDQGVVRGFQTRLIRRSLSGELSATAWIYEALDYLDGAVGVFQAMMGALGLNNPVKAFWNLIPFSFVVDMFLHVDKYLDRLTRLNPVGGWNVSDVTHSIKIKVDIDVEVWLRGLWYTTPTELHWPCGRLTFDSYERGLGLPVQLLSLGADLNFGQQTLLLALLHSLGEY